jgi:carbamoyltransferase
MKVLGINDGFDAGVAMVVDGKLTAAVNEERLSRIKFHRGYRDGFPYRSLEAVLGINDFSSSDIDAVAIPNFAFPPLHLRLQGLKTPSRDTADNAQSDPLPKGRLHRRAIDYLISLPSNSKLARASARLYKNALSRILRQYGMGKIPICFIDHHLSHAAAAYYTSGKEKGIAVTFDGYGDGHSGTISLCGQGQIHRLHAIPTAHSLALFYGAATVLAGFRFNRHEGKLTGLAARGKYSETLEAFQKMIEIDPTTYTIRSKLGVNQFDCIDTMKSILDGQFGREDIAAGAQAHLEDIVVSLIQHLIQNNDPFDLFCAGGLFANVKLNKEINELPEVKSFYAFPAMGDGGQAAGAALFVYHQMRPRKWHPQPLQSIYLGVESSHHHIRQGVQESGVPFKYYAHGIEEKVAELLAKGKIVARFNGRFEFGPRALGNRSILYQPTDPSVNDWLNRSLRRSEFMPFAPTTLEEDAPACYQQISSAAESARFMNVAFATTRAMQKRCPGVVHVDNTARPQVLRKRDNPNYYKIVQAYKQKTGLGTIINTSFNMHEEPIVTTAEEAVATFVSGHLDYLAIGNYLMGHPGNDRSKRP